MSKRGGKEAEREKSEPSAMMERLHWQLAWRDDERVAQALYAGEEMEEMHELSEAGLLFSLKLAKTSAFPLPLPPVRSSCAYIPN